MKKRIAKSLSPLALKYFTIAKLLVFLVDLLLLKVFPHIWTMLNIFGRFMNCFLYFNEHSYGIWNVKCCSTATIRFDVTISAFSKIYLPLGKKFLFSTCFLSELARSFLILIFYSKSLSVFSYTSCKMRPTCWKKFVGLLLA